MLDRASLFLPTEWIELRFFYLPRVIRQNAHLVSPLIPPVKHRERNRTTVERDRRVERRAAILRRRSARAVVEDSLGARRLPIDEVAGPREVPEEVRDIRQRVEGVQRVKGARRASSDAADGHVTAQLERVSRAITARVDDRVLRVRIEGEEANQ